MLAVIDSFLKRKSKLENPPYYGRLRNLRRRLRIGVLKEDEILELLLNFAIPYFDSKPLAKYLIQRFGSFAEVLDAPDEILQEIVAAESFKTLIRLVKTSAEFYLKGKALKRNTIFSLPSLIDYCHTAMGGLKNEQFRIIFLNSQSEIIAEDIIQEGTVNQAVVYPRKILELAIKYKATSLILVHNHPSGSPIPSCADRELTQLLKKTGSILNLYLLDHLIITRSGYFSMAQENML